MKHLKNMSSVLYFDCPTISSNIIGFDASGSQYLRKSALILCEGSWKDNKGVIHRFSPNRIYKIAERTNQQYQEGKRVGIYKDHRVDTDNKVGDYVGQFSVREITSADLDLESHPKLEILLGKMAIFADNQNIVLKDPEIIKKYQNGLVNGISPGINQTSDTIAEISITPRPAMAYATLFMEGEAGAIDPNSSPLTWGEINNSYKDFEEKEKKLDEIHEKFKQLLKNIGRTQNVQNSQQLLIEAVQGLYQQYLQELGLVQPDPSGIEGKAAQDINSPNNSTLERYQEIMTSLIQFAEGDDRRRRGLDPLGTIGVGALGLGALGAGGVGLETLRRRSLGGDRLQTNKALQKEVQTALGKDTSEALKEDLKDLRSQQADRQDIAAKRRRLAEVRRLEARNKRLTGNIGIGTKISQGQTVKDTVGDILNSIKNDDFVKGLVGRTTSGRVIRGAGAVAGLGTGLYLANRNRGY